MNEDTHDKLWVSFSIQNDHYCSWGRRGKKMLFKKHNGYIGMNNLQKLEKQKRDKGYNNIDEETFFSWFPEFKNNIEKYLIMATLSGKIK